MAKRSPAQTSREPAATCTCRRFTCDEPSRCQRDVPAEAKQDDIGGEHGDRRKEEVSRIAKLQGVHDGDDEGLDSDAEWEVASIEHPQAEPDFADGNQRRDGLSPIFP